MQSTTVEPVPDALWREMSPLLEDAMADLGASDRDAIVLRFFQNRSLADVGRALGIAERAAQKRVNRALEKLRKFFGKRGVVSTTAVIAGAISANSVQAAPAGLANSVSAMALAKGAAASASTLTLIKGALKLMAWTKTQTIAATAAIAILAAGTATMAVKHFVPKTQSSNVQTSFVTDSVMDTYLSRASLGDSTSLTKAPPVLSVQVTHFPPQTGNGAIWFDLPNTNWVQAIGRGDTLISLLQAAYGFNQAHMVLSSNLPDTNFDFMATLPQCSRKAFQDQIEKDIGVRGRPEVVPTDVLLLKVKTTQAPGLHIATTKHRAMRLSWAESFYWATNSPISDLASYFEDPNHFGQPVIDETGLTDKYNIRINWEPHNRDALNKVLLDQLGLELVPTNIPVEMLIVDKVK